MPIDDLNRELSIKDREYFSWLLDKDSKVAKRVVVSNLDEIEITPHGHEFDIAESNIPAIKAIYKTNGGVDSAESNATGGEANVIGISVKATVMGSKLEYQVFGRLNDSSLNFPLNDSVYLSTNGGLTNVAPTVGYRVKIGTSNGVGSMQIKLEEPINL